MIQRIIENTTYVTGEVAGDMVLSSSSSALFLEDQQNKGSWHVSISLKTIQYGAGESLNQLFCLFPVLPFEYPRSRVKTRVEARIEAPCFSRLRRG